MDPLLGSALIGAAGNVANGLFGFFGQLNTNKSTEKINEKNIALQREAWAREDTAVQRRMADLKAAGLSPTLAAGSAAASSGPAISLKNQESGLGKLGGGIGEAMQKAELYYRLKEMQAGAKTAEANAKAAEASANKINWENKFNEEMLPVLKMQEMEKLGIMQNENIMTSWNTEKTKRFWSDQFNVEFETKKLIMKQIEQDIKNKKWENAYKLSNLLINSFSAGSNAAAQSRRNDILLYNTMTK